jgi:hypothetical protein
MQKKLKNVFQSVRLTMPLLGGLQRLADAFNEIPRLKERREAGRLSDREQMRLDALLQTEKIVTFFVPHSPETNPEKPGPKDPSPLAMDGVRLFNETAETAPVTLRILPEHDPMNRRSVFQAGILPGCELASILFDVQRFVVWFGGANRLKRCWICRRWFVDRGKNQRANVCSKKCHGKYWTRPRRRAKKVEKARLTVKNTNLKRRATP